MSEPIGDLTVRMRDIFRLVVEVYLDRGQPVGSKALAGSVRRAGAKELADRLEQALADNVSVFALTIDERAIILDQLEDPPAGLAELRAVLLNEHEWRQREGLG